MVPTRMHNDVTRHACQSVPFKQTQLRCNTLMINSPTTLGTPRKRLPTAPPIPEALHFFFGGITYMDLWSTLPVRLPCTLYPGDHCPQDPVPTSIVTGHPHSNLQGPSRPAGHKDCLG